MLCKCTTASMWYSTLMGGKNTEACIWSGTMVFISTQSSKFIPRATMQFSFYSFQRNLTLATMRSMHFIRTPYIVSFWIRINLTLCSEMFKIWCSKISENVRDILLQNFFSSDTLQGCIWYDWKSETQYKAKYFGWFT